jgi:hypothetical protein
LSAELVDALRNRIPAVILKNRGKSLPGIKARIVEPAKVAAKGKKMLRFEAKWPGSPIDNAATTIAVQLNV